MSLHTHMVHLSYTCQYTQCSKLEGIQFASHRGERDVWLAAVSLSVPSDLAGKQCSSMADEQYSCSSCSKQFSSYGSLLRHQKKEHGVERRRNEKPRRKCEFSCRYVRQLRSHLSKEHSIKMDSELNNFSSEEGPSQHTSGCKPGWRHTHIHTQCQYS